jgi:hypothetical protein
MLLRQTGVWVRARTDVIADVPNPYKRLAEPGLRGFNTSPVEQDESAVAVADVIDSRGDEGSA